MGLRFEGNPSGIPVDATADGLAVHLPIGLTVDGNPLVTGYALLVCETDAGTVTGQATQRQIDISANYRARVGIDTMIFNDQFNGSALNTTTWSSTLVTYTVAVANGFMVLNNGNVTTASAVARVQTYRGFPAYGSYPLQLEVEAIYASSAIQPNNVVEIGFGFATGVATPTDGVFFRYTTSGTFICVVNYNGAETVSATLTPPAINVRHHYLIVVNNNSVEFWIDDVQQVSIAVPGGNGMAIINQNTPVLLRTFNGVTPPAAAVQLKVAQVNISIGDMHSTRPWPLMQAGMGGTAAQGQTGGTLGSTARAPAAGTAPTPAVPTNTTAALGTGLGGDFAHTNTLAVNVYGIISSYQVPTLAAATPTKSVYITGIRIDTTVLTALTNAGAANYVWALAFGHTSVSLATAESATTKAPRIIVLGQQGAIGALVAGTQLPSIQMTFDPILVQPGEFVQAIVKNAGTVGGGGSLLHAISFFGIQE